MRANGWKVLFLLPVLLAFGASAALQKQTGDPSLAADVQAELKSVEEGIAQVRNGNEDGGYTTLQAVIEAPAFDQLSEATQHTVLNLSGALALDHNDNNRALHFLRRSSRMSNSVGDDWYFRLDAAYRLDDMADAAQSLTTLAGAWPKTLARLKDQAIRRVADETYKLPDQELFGRLAASLFSAHWTQEGGIEPSYIWRNLALYHLQHADTGAARVVAGRITDPYVLVDMRADNRFAALITAEPTRFDVDKAAQNEIAQLRALAAANPRAMNWLNELSTSLLNTGRFEEALSLADQTVAQAKPQEGQAAAFDDIGNQLIWTMDNRARALGGLKRWDDAVAQLQRAARRPEHGELNVSQAINLGFLYFSLDRPDDALTAIEEVGGMSPYGRMQLEMVRFVSALEKQDAAAADKSLQYMRDHQSDAYRTFQEALLYADRMDEASQVMLTRLADPLWRTAALEQLQQFASPPLPPREAQMHDRLHALGGRPEVREAVGKVGKVEAYKLYEPAG